MSSMSKYASCRALAQAAVLVVGLVSILGTGGGGGDSGSGSGGATPPGSSGSVTISYPTADPRASTNCNSIFLSGEAFISPKWWRCCSGRPEDTGVTVTWENLTTGKTGITTQEVDVCHLFGTPYLCHHTWMTTIPLVVGDNQITITASDPAGVTGQDSITVVKPVLTYSISGKVTNAFDVGLWNYGRAGFGLTLTGTVPNPTIFTDTNGNYTISCIPSGPYSVTPSSTMAFSFTPPTREVTVSNADITSQDFVTEAYFISGAVTFPSGTGSSGVLVTLIGTNSSATYFTDSNGFYVFAVPNGSYTITPTDLLSDLLSFVPTSRDVTVDHSDVAEQDFVVQ
jgi:hypothetical protein